MGHKQLISLQYKLFLLITTSSITPHVASAQIFDRTRGDNSYSCQLRGFEESSLPDYRSLLKVLPQHRISLHEMPHILNRMHSGSFRHALAEKVFRAVTAHTYIPYSMTQQYVGTVGGRQTGIWRISDNVPQYTEEEARVMNTTLRSQIVSGHATAPSLQYTTTLNLPEDPEVNLTPTRGCYSITLDSSASPFLLALSGRINWPFPNSEFYCLCFINQTSGTEPSAIPIVFPDSSLVETFARRENFASRTSIIAYQSAVEGAISQTFGEHLNDLRMLSGNTQIQAATPAPNIGEPVHSENRNLSLSPPAGGDPNPQQTIFNQTTITESTSGTVADEPIGEAVVRSSADRCHNFQEDLNEFRLPAREAPRYWVRYQASSNRLHYSDLISEAFFGRFLGNPELLDRSIQHLVRLPAPQRAAFMSQYLEKLRHYERNEVFCAPTDERCRDASAAFFRFVSLSRSLSPQGVASFSAFIDSSPVPFFGRVHAPVSGRLERCSIRYQYTEPSNTAGATEPNRFSCRGVRYILNLAGSDQKISDFLDSVVVDICAGPSPRILTHIVPTRGIQTTVPPLLAQLWREKIYGLGHQLGVFLLGTVGATIERLPENHIFVETVLAEATRAQRHDPMVRLQAFMAFERAHPPQPTPAPLGGSVDAVNGFSERFQRYLDTHPLEE